LHISQASQVLIWRRKKILKKKFTEANFSSLVSYLLYAYQKKSTEKLLAKSILWAKLDMRILQRLALNNNNNNNASCDIRPSGQNGDRMGIILADLPQVKGRTT